MYRHWRTMKWVKISPSPSMWINRMLKSRFHRGSCNCVPTAIVRADGNQCAAVQVESTSMNRAQLDSQISEKKRSRGIPGFPSARDSTGFFERIKGSFERHYMISGAIVTSSKPRKILVPLICPQSNRAYLHNWKIASSSFCKTGSERRKKKHKR